MSVMARYITRLSELHDQLSEAEAQYQAAIAKVAAIQQSAGVGQLMYVPAGGSPIQLTVPPEAYKALLDDMTRASVNSGVSRMAALWAAVGSLSAEVAAYIANAEAKAGVVVANPPSQHVVTSEGFAAMCDNTAVNIPAVTGAGAPPATPPEITVPLPPRVRRIPGG